MIRTKTYPTQFPRRAAREYKRTDRAGQPWTAEEDTAIIDHYEEIGPTKMMKMVPGRSANSISVRAKMMGIIYKRTSKPELKEAKNPQEEKNIILEETRFLIETICGDNPTKRTKALNLLDYAASRNAAEWWSARRHWRLGRWCEMFISGHEYRTPTITREDFLEGDGVFIEKGGSDYAFYGRNG